MTNYFSDWFFKCSRIKFRDHLLCPDWEWINLYKCFKKQLLFFGPSNFTSENPKEIIQNTKNILCIKVLTKELFIDN